MANQNKCQFILRKNVLIGPSIGYVDTDTCTLYYTDGTKVDDAVLAITSSMDNGFYKNELRAYVKRLIDKCEDILYNDVVLKYVELESGTLDCNDRTYQSVLFELYSTNLRFISTYNKHFDTWNDKTVDIAWQAWILAVQVNKCYNT